MTNYAHGHTAEAQAVEYLKQHGYKIVEKNWRTRYCEIDIVAQRQRCVYFVEVKYRQTNWQGNGLDYITPKKLDQMTFAAELWVQSHQYSGGYALSAIEVSGPEFTITNFIADLT